VFAEEKEAVLKEINSLLSSNVALKGQFEVRETFDTAAGKFGIGHVNNYVYLDINIALQQIVQQTLKDSGKDP
jgi:hypothetical protein